MKILLIDDEKRQLDYLEIQLKRLNLEDVVKIQNPIEALKVLKAEHFDLVFLDVEMPELTGFELIQILGSENLPSVIFTTAHSKYAMEAFKVNALDYLLKPVDPEELRRVLEKVKSVQSNQALLKMIENPSGLSDDRIVVPQGQTYLLINYGDIIRVEGEGSYANFHLTDGRRITTSKRLNVYWKRLDKTVFFRPHQSHIINLSHVKSYSKSDGGNLTMINDHSVPVSSQMRAEIKKILKI